MRHMIAFTVCTMMLSAAPAFAINNSIATALPASLGEARTQSVTNLQVIYYNYWLKSGRSYVAYCWSPTAEGTGVGGGAIPRCTPSLRDSGDNSLGSFSNFNEPAIPGGIAVTYTPTSQGNYYVRVLSETTGTMRVLMLETTLFSPWYFVSPASGYESFVTVKNNTDYTISVTVTAFSPAGVAMGTVTRTIAGNGNTFFAVGAELGVSAGGSGSIQIANTANPGGVTANVTTMSSITGLSFDAPAVPKMVFSNFF